MAEEDIFHASLNLEEAYYAEGYREGATLGAQQGLIEGRIYGAQIAYERFLQVGLLYAKLDIWRAYATHGDSKPKLDKALARLEALLEALPRTNEEAEPGADYEAVLAGAIAKAKVIASLVGERMSLAQQGFLVDDAQASRDLEDGAEGAALLRGGKRLGCGSAN
ncbi:hypothetical protein BCR37DRAFT_397313 [Protomyces lactucae-debilis]|uniref:Essential protein Yae1 N-terminal domain-containing protein n=1 Tax=Protomyces lactucae-debilis TaxID=2754530 RepID=A0A1Y2FNX9_PROLT|nr:uncharacterized protein BCR37DRAFT_397313 [Protomyces lactucae-debilis]ORY85712.1 hypothetical protein BCR37DRAFT_397313 [Protomyces lactucae-debilis]